MLRYLLAAIVALTVIFAAPSLASAASCGGSGIGKVWVSGATSCGMGKATHKAVVKSATYNGETPSELYVRSPATGKWYWMRLSGRTYRGNMPVGIWRGTGAAGSTIRVEFWIP